MIITPLEVDYPARILGPVSDFSHTRSKGKPHLTDIIRDLAAAIGKSKGDGSISEEDLNWYSAGGWMWEHIWNLAHQKAVAAGEYEILSPGEIELDGIVGSPDRIKVLPDGTMILVELKCRWASVRKFEALETNYWQELCQIKSYCRMLETTHAELSVFFVAGDWRPPTPTARSVSIEFTERELDENWLSIKNWARKKGWI